MISDAATTLSADESLGLIEAYGVGTWTWNLLTAEVGWSPGMSRLLGISHDPDSQTVAQFMQHLHPDDRLDLGNPTRVAAVGVAEREYRVLRADGEMRWVRSYGKLIHSREGQAERLVGVAFDITDVRRGLVALRQRDGLEEALRELFDVVVWTTDADGEIRDELEWWRATGQPGHVDHWNRLEAVHPDDRQKVRDAWDEALRTRRRYAVSCRVRWNGGFAAVVSRAAAIIGRGGEVEGWVGFTARQDSNIAPAMEIVGADTTPLAPGQVRAARGYLGWSAEQLAEHAGVSFSTVRRVETPGERGVREQSISAIRKALERAGISFTMGVDGRTGVFMK